MPAMSAMWAMSAMSAMSWSSSPHGLVVEAGQSVVRVVGVLHPRQVGAVVEPVEGLAVVERLGVQRLVPVEVVHLRLDGTVARGVRRVGADADVAPEADVDVDLVRLQRVRRPLPAGVQRA